MTERSDVAWRFNHPDLAEQDAAPGLCVTPTGRIAMVSGSDSVRQSLRMLFSTMPGERVMWPEYGCKLHLLAFSPNDETTHGLAIHYVREAVARWEPRARLLDIDAQASDDAPERMLIRVRYRVADSRHEDTLQLSLDLQFSG